MVESPASFGARLGRARAQLPYLPRTFRLVWAAARPWTCAWMALLVAQGVLPAATVLLTRTVVDRLVQVVSAPDRWQVVEHSLGLAGLIILVVLLNEGLASVTAWVRTAQGELVQDHVHNLIHAQAVRLDLGFYETPDYYDRLHRARVDAIGQPVALLENVGSLGQNCITLVAMAGVLLAYAWWLPPVLFLSSLPVIWASGHATWRFHQWRAHNTLDERRSRYYDWLLTWHQAAAELRLFSLGEHFRSAFQNLRSKLRNERLQLARQQMLGELAAGLVGLAALGLLIGWLLHRSLTGRASLGDLALFYQVVSQGQRVMRGLFNSLGYSYRSVLFLENLFEFLKLEPTVTDPIASAAKSSPPVAAGRQPEIRFERITFCYPGERRKALEHFSLTVPAGKVVAIVGENGAGKSTLIKLMCRFYDPEAGRITLDGIDLRDWSLNLLHRQITVLFQEPVRYHDTVANNIAYGDLAAEPELDQLRTAASAAGAEGSIERLSEGYATLLGKWFGGAELSVGEWQRIALARAFLRRARVVVLDEPTSSMDSWAETDWMARFRELVNGRTAVVITHRFTTAMKADIIHVMEQGRIVESGSHAELLAFDGRYAQSWRQQTQQPDKA